MNDNKQYRQFFVGFIANLSTMAAGTCMGWSAPVIPKLSHPEMKDTPLSHVLSDNEASWIGSLVSLGAIFGPLIAGPSANIIGRKFTLLGSSSFFIISSILLLTTKSVTQICIARFLQGMGVGCTMVVQPMYLGEISTKEVRGALGSLIQLFLVIGAVYVHTIGPYVSYYALQWACLAIPVTFCIFFVFMPESPAFFVQKEKNLKAISSLKCLRGRNEVEDEVLEIQKSVDEGRKSSFLDIFRSKANQWALTIVVGLFVLQQLSGSTAIMYYSTSIFMKAAGSEGSFFSPAISTIMLSSVSLVFAAVNPIIVDRLGRKIILLFSAAGMAFAMVSINFFFIGLFFLFDAKEASFLSSISWLPIASLLLFVIVYSIGFGTVPFTIHSEIFAPEVKSQASTIIAMTTQITGFLVTKYFIVISNAIGEHWSFWIFTIFSIISCIFTQIMLHFINSNILGTLKIETNLSELIIENTDFKDIIVAENITIENTKISGNDIDALEFGKLSNYGKSECEDENSSSCKNFYFNFSAETGEIEIHYGVLGAILATLITGFVLFEVFYFKNKFKNDSEVKINQNMEEEVQEYYESVDLQVNNRENDDSCSRDLDYYEPEYAAVTSL
ncbi:solute carrier family 2, facilitated glucose transporter member 8-like [Culicoides brevitarsis]|uniref:solute carrier family 2, facilitated glucose transporter member 8-like n=1 Tax=Culicoides brevitarsis TaxID=469753 RepID=UPI00307B3102